MAGNQSLEAEWKVALKALGPNEAALLPGPEESGGKLERFELFPRLTSHARHKAKYFDLDLIEPLGFAFHRSRQDPWATGADGRFVTALKTSPMAALEGHVHRGDFSRWIGDVFHDPTLAADIRKVEQRYHLGHIRDLCGSIGAAIEERYEWPLLASRTVRPNSFRFSIQLGSGLPQLS